MENALYWVFLILLMSVVMWIPYILNVIQVMGLKAFGYAQRPELAPWAQRAWRAHMNNIENLAVFLPAVILYFMFAKETTGFINQICIWYFGARIVHYLCMLFKIPFLRTMAFVLGWLVQVCLIWHLGQIALSLPA